MEQNLFTVAEVQLVYKSKVKASEIPKITKSSDTFEVLKKHWNYETIEFIETFKVLLLNRANRVLGIIEISTGGMSETVGDPKVIFAAVIKSAASSAILCHNHPSANLTPSQADIKLTEKLKNAAKIFDIAILDHIILSSESYLALLMRVDLTHKTCQ